MSTLATSPLFERAIAHLFPIEGGFSNHPSDRGGKTKYGVTEKLARAWGYAGPMEQLDDATARAIAKQQFWDVLRLDFIGLLSEDVAYELFDTAYLCSPSVAGRILQRSLNALNRRAIDYPDVTVDGLIGLMTEDALRKFLKFRGRAGEQVLLKLLNCLQGAYFVDISVERELNEDFVFGWVANRIELEQHA